MIPSNFLYLETYPFYKIDVFETKSILSLFHNLGQKKTIFFRERLGDRLHLPPETSELLKVLHIYGRDRERNRYCQHSPLSSTMCLT